MLIYILIATFLETLVALVGLFFVFMGYSRLKKYLSYLVSFSVGTLLAVVFMELLPEAVEVTQSTDVFIYTLGGFLFFFILSKFLHWYHHHDECCESHSDIESSGYLILIGDFIHNFVDGVIISLAFIVNFEMGVLTTVAVLLHELPQELADFFILIQSGFSKTKALFLNFLVAFTTVIGATLTYFIFSSIETIIGPALGIVAGNFLYIATSDLLPKLHYKTKFQAILQFLFIIFGVLVIYTLTGIISE
ncbi:ZIP family metal transporter [Patescibacteria group bacterium]